MHFKVIFHLDGSGVYLDPNEPLHLDALISWALSPRLKLNKNLGRDDVPQHCPLPLLRYNIGDKWVWRASALFPAGPQGEDLQFWRKRFRQNRADLSKGSPNLKNGVYRDWNTPMPIMLTTQLVAYASGSRKQVKKLLRDVKAIGKKRAYGYGKVIRIDYEETKEDYSICKDGKAMRWLPDNSGTRDVRLQPPYWNRTGVVTCCEVGDDFRP